ncbi:MAG: hypothetical protein HQ594_06715 [Candidatus Omnitrophica bacterium]|nr:hypothetical protein [Candidatus Omnitrophota bacterium]
MRNVREDHYSLFSSLFFFFITRALFYEKIFSNFEISCEMGHACFSPSHIPEAIVCQNHGCRYYLYHWSDFSVENDRYLSSYLGCDKYLLWGKAHRTGFENREYDLIGYPFKKFINEVKFKRQEVLSAMGLRSRGKIISCFDESFGGEHKMTEEHFVDYWKVLLGIAQANSENTVIIRPKEIRRYMKLPDVLKKNFLETKETLEKLENVWIVDSKKWSFIEVIGVADVVVTQGMTSSATIAIICGINGLYFDEADYDHPFKDKFKDRIVFDSREKLLDMISKILNGSEKPITDISESLLREFDAYADDDGIERMREECGNVNVND